MSLKIFNGVLVQDAPELTGLNIVDGVLVDYGAAGAAVDIPIATASIVVAGFAPEVVFGDVLSIGTASIVLAGYAPIIVADKALLIGTAQILLNGYAPTIYSIKELLIGTGNITVSGQSLSLHLSEVYVPPDVHDPCGYWQKGAAEPLWDFTEQPSLPVLYHEHPHNPTVCGHWHKGPEVTTTALPKKIIPVVRAYDAVSLDDENWVGFLVWYTGSIKDAPIVVARDPSDERLWNISEELLAEGIYNALHGGGFSSGDADVIIIDKANDSMYTDGLDGQEELAPTTCDNLKNGEPGFDVGEAFSIEDWNDSSYASSSENWNHELNGYETFVGAPAHPMLYSGPFYNKWDSMFADSISLQTVAYDWKDESDPIWDEPEPDNYGPYVNDYGDTGVDNYYYPDYIDAYHLTPTGYDHSQFETKCDNTHQFWAWGAITVDGNPVDAVYVGGSFDAFQLEMGSASHNEDYMYQGCDWTDLGGGGSEPIPGSGAGSVNGHYWWLMVDSWPAAESPVFFTWMDSGAGDWTREQYALVGGTLIDANNHQWGVFEVWNGNSIAQTKAYWCDYEAQNGIFFVDSPILRKDEETYSHEQLITLYRPKAVFYLAGGAVKSYDFDKVDDMIPDRKTTGSYYPGYPGTVLDGPTESVIDVESIYFLNGHGDNGECWSPYEAGYLCLANPCSWSHAKTVEYVTPKVWTWLVWYNSITGTFESNGRDVEPEQQDYAAYAIFQTYVDKEGSTYYHNATASDLSASDGSSSTLARARQRFAIEYEDLTYSGKVGTGETDVPVCNPVWPFS